MDNAASLILGKIPRDGSWYEYLDLDTRGRRILGKQTPEEIIGSTAWHPESDSQARARYGELNIKVVAPKTKIKADNFRQWFLLTLFHKTRRAYRSLLEELVLGWKPDDFPFREIAFALISLAAGELVFECQDTLNRDYGSEGYFLVPSGRVQDPSEMLLPKFLGESHLPGKESGSAPMGTTFWLGNVLIYLASRLDLLDIEESSVAKAVDTGLSQGLKNFHAAVFSILNCVLIQVRVDETGVQVQRSPLMSLFYFTEENSSSAVGPRSRTVNTGHGKAIESDSEDEIDLASKNLRSGSIAQKGSFLNVSQNAFVALMHLFDAAASQQLRGAKSKIFPNEILAAIMELSDAHTSLALAKVSAFCQVERCRKFPLNNDYALAGVDPKKKKNVNLILVGRITGEKTRFPAYYVNEREGRRRGAARK